MIDATTTPGIEPATIAHAAGVLALVRAAYAMYVPRIGREPAPMRADMPARIARGGVYVLVVGDRLLGTIRLTRHADALEVDDLAVDPAAQGQGLGRRLLTFAEETARARGLAHLTLYTNAAMTENLALYAHLGFEETGRRRQDGFDRVYFSKTTGSLPAPAPDGSRPSA